MQLPVSRINDQHGNRAGATLSLPVAPTRRSASERVGEVPIGQSLIWEILLTQEDFIVLRGGSLFLGKCQCYVPTREMVLRGQFPLP